MEVPYDGTETYFSIMGCENNLGRPKEEELQPGQLSDKSRGPDPTFGVLRSIPGGLSWK